MLFTNGKQDRGQLSSTLSEAQKLRHKGIKLIALGIQKPDLVNLVKIASNELNVYFLKTPDRIVSIAKKIVQSLCGKA